MRPWAFTLAAVALALPAGAQTAVRPVVITTVAGLPVSTEDGRPYMVTDALSSSDCTTGGGTEIALCAYDASAAAYVALSGASGSGDVTAVGDCATGACFSSVTARHAFLGPVGGGTAAFRAIVEADISDLSHAPGAGDFGALALTGDVTSTGLTTTLAADSVGLTELSACTGPDEIVEYGASGVPTCIATPSGGGGDATGIDADGDGTREISVAGGAISFDANDDGNPAEMVLNSNAQLVLTYPGYGYPFGEVVKITTTGQTLSLYQSGAGGRAQVYSTNRMSLQGGNGAASIELAQGGASTIEMMDRVVNSPSTVTCTDSGDGSPGAVTITPTTSFVQLTNSDADGCAVTLSESGAAVGQGVEIIVVSSAGGTVDFADTAGVTELAGAFSAGQWDALTLRYSVDRWVETARSNN